MTQSLKAFDAGSDFEKAFNIGPQGIDISYQRAGKVDAPPVLLIMGLAAQSIAWPNSFCNELLERGLQVIRLDNRDVGESTHLTSGPPNFPAVLKGDFSTVPYTLSDMAADAAGLLRTLQIGQAHLVGASMGGAIAQTIAIEHPECARSIVSMMSTTGNMAVGQPSPEVMSQMFGGPPVVTREEAIQRSLRNLRLVGSSGYTCNDEDEAVERVSRAYDRSYDPVGIVRQAAAAVASGDRTEKLRRLKVPTLAIHGTADRMCDVSGGRATADAIAGAELVIIEGMGHDLAPVFRSRIAKLIADFVWRVENS